MQDIVLGFLGPYTPLILGLTFAAVFYFRQAIRKRHILRLLVTAVAALVAFFGLILWSFSWYTGQKTLVVVHAALSILAALFVSSSTAIGFSFILKHMGLAPLEDAGTRTLKDQRQRR